jgi:hypothetical protein
LTSFRIVGSFNRPPPTRRPSTGLGLSNGFTDARGWFRGFPDSETTRYNVNVRGNPEISRNLSTRLSDLFEGFDCYD